MDAVIYGIIVEVDKNHFMYCDYKGIKSFSTRDEAYQYACGKDQLLTRKPLSCEVVWFPSVN